MNDDDATAVGIPDYRVSKKDSTKSAELVLMEGGCKNQNNPTKPYHNGSEYHPFIDSLGEYKCVTCKCKVSINFLLSVTYLVVKTSYQIYWSTVCNCDIRIQSSNAPSGA